MIYTNYYERVMQEGRAVCHVEAIYQVGDNRFNREGEAKSISDGYALLRQWRAEFKDSLKTPAAE